MSESTLTRFCRESEEALGFRNYEYALRNAVKELDALRAELAACQARLEKAEKVCKIIMDQKYRWGEPDDYDWDDINDVLAAWREQKGE